MAGAANVDRTFSDLADFANTNPKLRTSQQFGAPAQVVDGQYREV
jgi:hypothetical protein